MVSAKLQKKAIIINDFIVYAILGLIVKVNMTYNEFTFYSN